MKILLVNDDGIDAQGLKHLVDWAKTKGEVYVFAPRIQQSGKSHSIEIHDGYEVKKVDLYDGIECYSVDSTPADCVRIAVLAMKKKPDLVISGINCGFNVGEDIHYSGTVGACFEAVRLGFKAMAVSTCVNSFDNAVRQIDRIYNYIESKKMFHYTKLLNINIPEDGEEILITQMGPAIYTDHFTFEENNMVMPHLVCLYNGSKNLHYDTDATMNGYITITPLSTNLTNATAYEKFRNL